jgi:hypothetical protein
MDGLILVFFLFFAVYEKEAISQGAKERQSQRQPLLRQAYSAASCEKTQKAQKTES